MLLSHREEDGLSGGSGDRANHGNGPCLPVCEQEGSLREADYPTFSDGCVPDFLAVYVGQAVSSVVRSVIRMERIFGADALSKKERKRKQNLFVKIDRMK